MNKTTLFLKFITVNICFFLFTMCQNGKNERKTDRTIKPDSLIVINIDKLNFERPILFSSVFQNIKILALETKEDCLIGKINQLEMSDDTLFILDSYSAKALFLFDNNGKYLKKIGKIGKGPGEYSHISSFSLDLKKRQIQILDPQQQKIIIFSTQGKLINEIKLSGNMLPIQIATQDELIYIDQLISKDTKAEFLLYAINNSGKIVSRWLPYQIYDKGLEQPYNSSLNFFKAEDDIKYVKPLFDTIFSLNHGTVKPYLAVTTKNKITNEDIQEMNKIMDVTKFLDYYIRCNKFLGITHYKESRSLITFKYQNNRTTHNLFIFKNDHNIQCTTRLIDDLTQQTYISPFYSTYKNYFIACIQNTFPENIKEFMENVKNGKINLSKKEQEIVEKLTPNSNPLIVFYNCRENFSSKIH